MSIRIDDLSDISGHCTEIVFVVIPENIFKPDSQVQIPAARFQPVTWNQSDSSDASLVESTVRCRFRLESSQNAPTAVLYKTSQAIQKDPTFVLFVNRHAIRESERLVIQSIIRDSAP